MSAEKVRGAVFRVTESTTDRLCLEASRANRAAPLLLGAAAALFGGGGVALGLAWRSGQLIAAPTDGAIGPWLLVAFGVAVGLVLLGFALGAARLRRSALFDRGTDRLEVRFSRRDALEGPLSAIEEVAVRHRVRKRQNSAGTFTRYESWRIDLRFTDGSELALDESQREAPLRELAGRIATLAGVEVTNHAPSEPERPTDTAAPRIWRAPELPGRPIRRTTSRDAVRWRWRPSYDPTRNTVLLGGCLFITALAVTLIRLGLFSDGAFILVFVGGFAGLLSLLFWLTLWFHLFGSTELTVDPDGVHLRNRPAWGRLGERDGAPSSSGRTRFKLDAQGQVELFVEMDGTWLNVLTMSAGASALPLMDVLALARDVAQTAQR